MNIERPVLSCSMMERYEIEAHRPTEIRAVLFGADELMLGGVARNLDDAGIGALCVTSSADKLNKQDGMFTVLVRGGGVEKTQETVVQSILTAVDPENDFDAFLSYAHTGSIDMVFCHAEAEMVELGLAARFLYAVREETGKMPAVCLVSDLPEENCIYSVRNAMNAIAEKWGLSGLTEHPDIYPVLCEGLFGKLSSAEAENRQQAMNYSDSFLMWSRPQVRLFSSLKGYAPITYTEDIAGEIDYSARVDHALEFMCVSAGFLAGFDTFAQVMADETLRKWIANAWFREMMPFLRSVPLIEERTIRVFGKYEDNYNDVPLLSAHKMIRRMMRTVMPAVRAYAMENFEAPRLTVFAISSAIMLYTGAAFDEGGYRALRGNESYALNDDSEILREFSAFAHDMPAESLAYAVLADRALWGEDLREIDGLEFAIMNDISSIQRIGFKETLSNLIELIEE